MLFVLSCRPVLPVKFVNTKIHGGQTRFVSITPVVRTGGNGGGRSAAISAGTIRSKAVGFMDSRSLRY